MIIRTISIFPNFKNMEYIDEVRKKYDSLYLIAPPHITLVFPFESNLETNHFKRHVENVISSIKSFTIRAQNITGSEDKYLFLNIKKGNDEIIKMHDYLYEGILKEYLLRTLTYIPHLTVGRIEDDEEFRNAVMETESFNHVFETEVTEIVSEIIDDKGYSTVEFRMQL